MEGHRIWDWKIRMFHQLIALALGPKFLELCGPYVSQECSLAMECLPSLCKALGSILSTPKQTNKQNPTKHTYTHTHTHTHTHTNQDCSCETSNNVHKATDWSRCWFPVNQSAGFGPLVVFSHRDSGAGHVTCLANETWLWHHRGLASICALGLTLWNPDAT
jgi:hypothetical protein